MAQTVLINNVLRSDSFPVEVSASANDHCGLLQLILDEDWTEQMIHELPTINISICLEDDSKVTSFDVNMSTVSESFKTASDGSVEIEPVNPYSIPVYGLPDSFKFIITPMFDKYALISHNDLIDSGEVQIFETSNIGIVNTNPNTYSNKRWVGQTEEFPITISFDDSNVSSK